MKRRILVSLFLLAAFCAGSAFAQTGEKATYGIFLDNSGSMLLQIESVKVLGKEIVAQTHRKGLVSVYNFVNAGKSLDINTLISQSREREKLDSKIDGLHPEAGKTTLFDAIEAAGKKLNSKDAAALQKILILVTDGNDKNSTIKRDEVIKKLKASNIKVYAVGLIQTLPTEAVSKKDKKNKVNPREEAKDFLSELAEETSGRAVFPKIGDNVAEVVKNLLSE